MQLSQLLQNFSWPCHLSVDDATRFLAALLTPLIACIAVLIAWQQKRTAHQKLILDLFDRRFRIFKEVNFILNHAMQNGDLSTEQLLLYIRSVSDAEFLFRKEIVDYIDEIYRHGCNLSQFNQELHAPGPGLTSEKRKATAAKVTTELLWLSDQFVHSKDMFREYLDLSKAKCS